MELMLTTVSRDTFERVMVPNYSPLGMVPVKGSGSRVWDQVGKEYVDFSGGIAVNALGHCHPVLVQALSEQAHKLWHISNIYTNEPALRLATDLTRLTFAERVFFANSGAEANEAAFKLARRYGVSSGGVAKHEIVAMHNSFHGRSLFTVSVGGQPKYSSGFGPAIEGIRHVAFNDIEQLEATVSDVTCAVVLEPILGESGVVPATRAYLKRARELCTKHGALLIFDEVQTGIGRLGSLFAYEHYQVVPDIMTVAKAIGGGFPLAAMLTTSDIAANFTPGTHGSTFGGNPLACAVGEAALGVIRRPETLRGVVERHDYLVPALLSLGQRHALFNEIRGIGLLLGCVLSPQWKGRARDIVNACLQRGLMVLQAGPDVIRLAPSLVVEQDDLDEGLSRLESTASVLAAGN
ncbi:acetylornithine/succinyldiaminopimelate transaminase [Pseudomonas lini]